MWIEVFMACAFAMFVGGVGGYLIGHWRGEDFERLFSDNHARYLEGFAKGFAAGQLYMRGFYERR